MPDSEPEGSIIELSKDVPRFVDQPDRVAIVFSNSDEGREMQRHIDFLHARGELLDDLEKLDLEDLPGVQGLKAFRVTVNVDADESIRPAEIAFESNR